MARPYPTDNEVKAKRPDIENYVGTGTIAIFINEALPYLKRDIENRRGIRWSQVFVGTAFLDNEDATGRNESNIVHLLVLRTIALVFEAYSVKSQDGQFWEISHAYRADYDALLSECKLDVDTDDDGTIDEAEEAATGQPFFTR